MNFSVVNMSRMDIPVATEFIKTRGDYVPFGITDQDDYFDIITESYQTSTTNASCIEGISDLIYGNGLYSKNLQYKSIIESIIEQDDIKRISFDIKLYGGSAVQVYWDDKHTKVIKFYHTPVQNIRAAKLSNTPKIETYYYCTDWNDYKLIKKKKSIPAFGTSKEKMELLYIKNYSPGKYYYSLPDWFSSLQLAFVEAELNNLHFNNVSNGFFPSAMIQFNNGIPNKEERDANENQIQKKFGGSKNAGRFMTLYNTSKETAAEITPIDIPDLAVKFEYVANYSQDRILVSHRVTSPLLFGIRTSTNGFSSNADELTTAYSILQTMTINPFQNLIINNLEKALKLGGYNDPQLYFEQLTPLIMLTEQAEATDQTVQEVQTDINDINQ